MKNIRTTTHLRTLIGLLLLALTGCDKETEKFIDIPTIDSKPNILLVIADDIGIEATPGYEIGSIKPNMPNLEKLASAGITFENAWAYPVCAPTRSSIITGRYGYRTGVLNAESASSIPNSEVTLQSFIDENPNLAYSHSVFGKWHLSNNNPDGPANMGIGHYAGVLGGGVQDYFAWNLTQNGQTNPTDEYCTTKITDMAIEWVNDQSDPWFCWVAYTAAHTPFHLPPDSLHMQGALPADQASIDANPTPYYMAMIESIDHEIGRLLANIPADELNNTTIIYLGDNGSPRTVIQSPYSQNQGKGSLYQGGVHVPLVLSGKSVSRKGQRDHNLVNSADLFATIAEITGIDLPIYSDSYSFYSLLTSDGVGLRDYNYSEILNEDQPDRSGFTIRNEQYKLIQFDDGEREMYDLADDPYEKSNLLEADLTEDQQFAFEDLMNRADEIRQ
jgi:arylsulfatase A-like enzyme